MRFLLKLAHPLLTFSRTTGMEVLKNNFEAQLNSIKESIKIADFIAIDTEFSGKYSYSLPA